MRLKAAKGCNLAPTGPVPDEPRFENYSECYAALAPFGFTPIEPRFGNSLRQFSNPRSTGMKPAGTTF